MPGGDRTGPGGMGPMTGRGAGYCAGYTTPGFMNPYGGRGMGYGGMRGGRGGGFGRGRGFGQYVAPFAPAAYPVVPSAYPAAPVVPQPGYGSVPYDESAELEALRHQSQAIESTLSMIQQRIETLEAQSNKKESDG